MANTITARRLITDIGSVEFAVIETSADGLITDIYSDPKSLHDDTSTLTSAFLDIHTHGALGHDVMQASPAALAEMQRFLATRGVAYYLPTTVTAPIDAILRSLDTLANAIERAASQTSENEARPIGIHLEGPFLSHAKRGVHALAELLPPSIELFDRFQTAARGHIKLITIAPEPNAVFEPKTAGAPFSTTASPWSEAGSDGDVPLIAQPHRAMGGEGQSPALDLIRHAAAQGVRISLGHTNATTAETLAAIDAGATSATHTFNAMRALDHREPGVLGIVLDDARLYAELICDGVHVAPPLVRLWLKSKGIDRAILVTDSMSATGMPDGDYALGHFTARVANGRALLAADLATGKQTLAGSVLTMDQAVANLQRFTGASIGDATRLASHNPAAMLGLPELTRLSPGMLANLNRFDAQGRLTGTYLRGRKLS